MLRCRDGSSLEASSDDLQLLQLQSIQNTKKTWRSWYMNHPQCVVYEVLFMKCTSVILGSLLFLLVLQLYLHIYIHIIIWNQDNYDMYPDNNHRNDNYHDTIYIYTLSIYQDSSELYIYVSNPWGYLQIIQSLDHDLVLKQPWWLGNPPLKNYSISYPAMLYMYIMVYPYISSFIIYPYTNSNLQLYMTNILIVYHYIYIYIYIHNVYMYTI